MSGIANATTTCEIEVTNEMIAVGIEELLAIDLACPYREELEAALTSAFKRMCAIPTLSAHGEPETAL